MIPDRTVVTAIREQVAEKLMARHAEDEASGRPRMALDDERVFARRVINDALEEHAHQAIAAGDEFITPEVEDAIARAVYDALFGLGRLQPLLEDDSITDIHAQGHDQVYVVREDGSKERADPIAESDAELVELIRLAGARLGRSERRFDAANPELNLQLPTAVACSR